MGLFDLLGLTSYLGYDAVKDQGKRRAVTQRVYSQDTYLKGQHRDSMMATVLDAQRNFALCSWMVRKHLDYVASFGFQCKTDSDELNDSVERWMRSWGKDCDVRGRHPFRRMIRLAEATRTVSGDVFIQKIEKGRYRGKLQAIEPDLIRTPSYDIDPSRLLQFREPGWVNGVHVDSYGRADSLCLTRRLENGDYELQRMLPADSVFTLGYFERFDQVRGVSPLASALSLMQDYFESIDSSFLKVKLAAAFGLVTYRDSLDPFPGTTATVDSDGDGIMDSGFEVNLSNGPFSLELGQEDRAEVLESRSPATEVVNFLAMASELIVKCLDLPVSFLDESRPTFHGGHAGLKNYQRSCREKQADIIDFLNSITDWRLAMAVADGEIALPSGMQFDDVEWEWVPAGMPYWNEEKELASEIAAIAAGLDNLEDAAKRHGRDFYENCVANARAMAKAEELGVDIVLEKYTSRTSATSTDGDVPEQEITEPQAEQDEV